MQSSSNQFLQPGIVPGGNIQQLSTQSQPMTNTTFNPVPVSTIQNHTPQVIQPASLTLVPTMRDTVRETSIISNQGLGLGLGTSSVNQSIEQGRVRQNLQNVKYEFGKLRGVEVLTFKDAELERTLGNNTTFAAVGIFSVLYFENYDRFILSLNDWKYALLKRMPIVSSELTLVGPVYYTLPTLNGFYTLKLTKIPHMEALKNLETILINNSKLSYKGQENILGRGLSPDDRFRGSVTPLDDFPAEVGSRGTIDYLDTFSTDLEHANPGPLSKKDKIKRGFKKIGFAFTKGFSRRGKHNLNQYQARDLESIKATTPIMAPYHLYPRKEVERWINYNKEIAYKLNFMPELPPEGFESALPTMRSRAYGSVDLGQGYLSGVHPSLIEGISSTSRPTGLPLTSSVRPITTRSLMGYSRPKFTDKIKAKLPGQYRYHGEIIDPSKTIVHQTLENPLPGVSTTRGNYSNPPLTDHYIKNFGEPIHYQAENLTTNAPLKSQNISYRESSVPQTLAERVSSVLVGKNENFGPSGTSQEIGMDSIQNMQASSTLQEGASRNKLAQSLDFNQGLIRREVNLNQPLSNQFEAIRSQENMAPYQG